MFGSQGAWNLSLTLSVAVYTVCVRVHVVCIVCRCACVCRALVSSAFLQGLSTCEERSIQLSLAASQAARLRGRVWRREGRGVELKNAHAPMHIMMCLFTYVWLSIASRFVVSVCFFFSPRCVISLMCVCAGMNRNDFGLCLLSRKRRRGRLWRPDHSPRDGSRQQSVWSARSVSSFCLHCVLLMLLQDRVFATSC